MSERLVARGSILELTMRRFALGKDSLRLFPIRAKQSTRCGGPACGKTSEKTKKVALLWCGLIYAEWLDIRFIRTNI